MALVPFLLLIYLSVGANSETKIWMPKDQQIDEWFAHPIKCPKTALKFDGKGDMEFLHGNSHEKSIVFAESGWYILSQDAYIVLGDSPATTSSECANAFGQEVIVHSAKAAPWAAPQNWYSESNGNPAKPDIEKIPCDFDEVVFNNSMIRVDLDGLYQLEMKRVYIDGHWLRAREFGSFCATVPGQKMFENCDSVNMAEPMGEFAIRSCQSKAHFIESVICENVKCPVAKCVDPIRPSGFCCQICGASASVEIHHDTNARMLVDLNSFLARKLTELAGDGLSFYSSYFNYKTWFKLQINIVDRRNYMLESVNVMDKIVMDLRKRFDNLDVLKSGMPYDPTVDSNTFAVIFMPLLLVSAIFFIAYKMSYDVPLRLLVNRVTGRSQFIFAQFENVMEDHEGRITISHTAPEPAVEAIGVAAVSKEESGIELVAGGPDKSTLARDKLDEIVETISSSTEDNADLISVDM